MSHLDKFEKDNNVKQQSSNYPYIKRPNPNPLDKNWTPIADQASSILGDMVFATDTKESSTLLSSLALRFKITKVKDSTDKNGTKFRLYKLDAIAIA